MTNESGYQPNGDLVLIKPAEVVKKTAGGIVLPESTRKAEGAATRYGIVVAMGDQARQHPRMKGISEGDTVLFPRYIQDTLTVNDVDWFIMRDQQVLGKIDVVPDFSLNAARSTVDTFGVNVP